MPAPAGWSLTYIKEGGKTQRKAVTPTGEVVPYVRYLNAQAQQSGFANHNAYVKWERNNRKFVRDFRHRARNKDSLQLGGRGLAKLLLTFFNSDLQRKEVPISRAATGQLAQLLTTIGLRPATAKQDVGDEDYKPYGV